MKERPHSGQRALLGAGERACCRRERTVTTWKRRNISTLGGEAAKVGGAGSNVTQRALSLVVATGPLALWLTVAGCGPTPEEPPTYGSGGEPPMEVEELPPSACGDLVIEGCDLSCSEEMPCPPGLHCKSGACGADCAQSGDCAETEECAADGRCAVDSNITLDPLETDPDRPEEEVPECIEGEVEFEAVVPEVSLLLDRSGSMSGGLGTVTRWDALGLVLLGDPTVAGDHGVVGDFEDRVAFGASFYTSGGGGPYGCVLDLESVALARNNYTSIRQRYQQIGPSGGTPTGEAVNAVVANALDADLGGGPKILVLATDGEPTGCGISSDPAGDVERGVSSAFEDGMKTFAISIATDTDPTHMQRVANLGAGLPVDADPPAPYYTAESQEDLALAFASILEEVPRSCVFALNGKVDPDQADEGTVTLAGEELVYEDPDGWILPQVDQVELLGGACEQIRAGEEDLDITFPCSVFTPVVK